MRFVCRLLLGLCATAVVIALPASGDEHIPLGEHRVEWEPNDPALHGQVIRFLEPMVYVLLDQQNIGEFLKEEVEIGRFVFSKESAIAFSKVYLSQVTEDLDSDRWFTIKATYWHRRDWSDIRKIVLEDDRGIRSTATFAILNSSDRKDFFPVMPWDVEKEQ